MKFVEPKTAVTVFLSYDSVKAECLTEKQRELLELIEKKEVVGVIQAGERLGISGGSASTRLANIVFSFEAYGTAAGQMYLRQYLDSFYINKVDYSSKKRQKNKWKKLQKQGRTRFISEDVVMRLVNKFRQRRTG